jgi:hypothetical protein
VGHHAMQRHFVSNTKCRDVHAFSILPRMSSPATAARLQPNDRGAALCLELLKCASVRQWRRPLDWGTVWAIEVSSQG